MPVVPQTLQEFIAGDPEGTSLDRELKRMRVEYLRDLPAKQAQATRLAFDKAGREAEMHELGIVEKAQAIEKGTLDIARTKYDFIQELKTSDARLESEQAERDFGIYDKLIKQTASLGSVEQRKAYLKAIIPQLPARCRRGALAINPSHKTVQEIEDDIFRALSPRMQAESVHRKTHPELFDPDIGKPTQDQLEDLTDSLEDEYEDVAGVGWFDIEEPGVISRAGKLLGHTEPRELTKADLMRAALIQWYNMGREAKTQELTIGKEMVEESADELIHQESMDKMQKTIESVGQISLKYPTTTKEAVGKEKKTAEDKRAEGEIDVKSMTDEDLKMLIDMGSAVPGIHEEASKRRDLQRKREAAPQDEKPKPKPEPTPTPTRRVVKPKPGEWGSWGSW